MRGGETSFVWMLWVLIAEDESKTFRHKIYLKNYEFRQVALGWASTNIVVPVNERHSTQWE